MQWNTEKTFSLLELFEQHPILWRKSLIGYNNKVKRGDALIKIATSFENCTNNDVKDKIRSLRKVYAEKLRQIKAAQKKSGSSPKLVKWEFFKAMEFLRGETSDASPMESITETIEEVIVKTESDMFLIAEETWESASSLPSRSTMSLPIKRKRKHDVDPIDLKVEERKTNMDKLIKKIEENEKDENRTFSNLVYGFLDDLKDPHLEEMTRMKFRSVMNEISTIRCNEFFLQQQQ